MVKVLNATKDIPNTVTFRGHTYYHGANFANLETVRREVRYFRATTKWARFVIRKFYIQPSRPYAIYAVFHRSVKK